MDLLVTYDIATPDKAGERRLARVAAVCERYGQRIQYSVFECRVSDTGFEHLVGELEDAIDARLDSVHLYRATGVLADARLVIGRPLHQTLGQPWIL